MFCQLCLPSSLQAGLGRGWGWRGSGCQGVGRPFLRLSVTPLPATRTLLSRRTTHDTFRGVGKPSLGQSPGPGATDLVGFSLCCFQVRRLPWPQSSPLRDGVAEDAGLPRLWQGLRVPGGAISILQLRTPKLTGVK